MGTNRAGYTAAKAILALQVRLDEKRCYIHFAMHDLLGWRLISQLGIAKS